MPLCSEHSTQLYHSTAQCTVPRVLTTIHWIPSAKDLCRSQTHLKRKTAASALRGGRPSTTSPPRLQPGPGPAPGRVTASRGGEPGAEAARARGGPARTPRDLQSSTAACCRGRFWTRAKPGPGAYRKVAVSAGMLLRNVKIITTNMKTRRRGFL